MHIRKSIACAALAACLASTVGCATNTGVTARRDVLAPGAVAAWATLKPYTWRGIDDAVAKGELVDGSDENPGTADFVRRLVMEYDESMRKLGGGS